MGGLDIHTFSQLILRSWGDVRTDTPHEKQHRELGEVIKNTIKSVHGKDYTCVHHTTLSIPRHITDMLVPGYRNQKALDLYVTIGTTLSYFTAFSGACRVADEIPAL